MDFQSRPPVPALPMLMFTPKRREVLLLDDSSCLLGKWRSVLSQPQVRWVCADRQGHPEDSWKTCCGQRAKCPVGLWLACWPQRRETRSSHCVLWEAPRPGLAWP